jgi:hypothetical protein
MTRTATGATLALLDKLEPEAKAAWEDEILNIQEAVQASRAITERRVANVSADMNTIAVRSLPAETQDALPPGLREVYDPDYNIPPSP